MIDLNNARVVIIGSGPTGLGAAWRLQELGFENWQIFEQEAFVGGLAASFVDNAGFTWDIGGHVQFSHYSYFDRLMDLLLGHQWLSHERESWIWMRNRFIPYPFQNNIRHLPEREMKDCLTGLIRACMTKAIDPPANFDEWILKQFGKGIADHFMRPYNFKVWANPTCDLDYRWVGERVAKVDLERVVLNLLESRDDVSWGPNNMFRFPLRGGTGAIWKELAARLPSERILFAKRLKNVEAKRKVLHFDDGSREEYDVLISTAPLDWLVQNSDLSNLKGASGYLIHSSTHVIGVGLKGEPPPHLRKKCWMYFPEESPPFYRATVFSNYSPNNVPDIRQYWSLMLEVAESPAKPVKRDKLIDSVIEGLICAHLIENMNEIADVWQYRAEYGYPTPSLHRDEALAELLPCLEQYGIFSRGRFGAWKYEVSNQDHSLMQGVEIVDRLTKGAEEQTLDIPDIVNSRGSQ
jgi:protoporphyrinogen oxidase